MYFNVNKKQKTIFSLAMIGVILFTVVAPLPFNGFDRNIVNAQGDTSAYGRGTAPGTSANSSAHIEKALDAANVDDDKCGFRNLDNCVEKAGRFLAKWIGGVMLMIAGWFLGVAGLLLDISITYTVLEMSERVKNLASINTAWSTFRDLANIFFIFIILYIAIMTILRMDTSTTKKLLVHVIIIALLLNFSLFFTKIAIDASNITATFFYEQIKDAGGDMGLSGAFMQKLGLQSFFDPEGAARLLSQNEKLSAMNILLMGILASVLFVVVACVFIAAAILFIVRFIVFIFLMVLSPLAFAAMALPKDEWSEKWWSTLFSQAIFAPAFFALMWITLTILGGLTGNLDDQSFLALIPQEGQKGFFEGNIKIILNFIIIIGMALFAIIAAKLLGVQGGEKATKWATNASRRVISAPARQTGRLAAGADSWLGKTRFGNTLIGSAIRAPLGAVGKSKFGSKGPSGADLNKAAKKRTETYGAIKAERERRRAEKLAEQVRETRTRRVEAVREGRIKRQEQKYQDRLAEIKREEQALVSGGAATQDEAAKWAREEAVKARESHVSQVEKIRAEAKERTSKGELHAQRTFDQEKARRVAQLEQSTSWRPLRRAKRRAAAEKLRGAKMGTKVEGPKDTLEDMLEKYLKNKDKKGKDASGDKKPE